MYISANRLNVYNEWFCFQQNMLTGLNINYNSIHNLELIPTPFSPRSKLMNSKYIEVVSIACILLTKLLLLIILSIVQQSF